MIRVEGSTSILKKFIFPQYFNKNSLNKKVSLLFERLAREKVPNKFECEISHEWSYTIILNESVNKVLIPSHPELSYRLLTNQLSMSGSKKMVKMCALIEEQTYYMIQLITNKDVLVNLHPSQEMLS